MHPEAYQAQYTWIDPKKSPREEDTKEPFVNLGAWEVATLG